MKKSVLLASLVLCAACSPGSFNGTVAGNGLNVQDAIFAALKDDSGATMGVVMAMSDVPDLCTLMKTNKQPKNATMVAFFLMDISADYNFATPAAGDYAIVTSPTSAGKYANGAFTKLDATCTETLPLTQRGTSAGTVKVSSIKIEEGGTMSGTFDVTFGTSDKGTGSFDASYCDMPTTSTNPTCE